MSGGSWDPPRVYLVCSHISGIDQADTIDMSELNEFNVGGVSSFV